MTRCCAGGESGVLAHRLKRLGVDVFPSMSKRGAPSRDCDILLSSQLFAIDSVQRESQQILLITIRQRVQGPLAPDYAILITN